MPRVSLRESELKDILDTLLAIRNDAFAGSGKAGNSSRPHPFQKLPEI